MAVWDSAVTDRQPRSPIRQCTPLIQPVHNVSGYAAQVKSAVSIVGHAHGLEELQLGMRRSDNANKVPVNVVGVEDEYYGRRQVLIVHNLSVDISEVFLFAHVANQTSEVHRKVLDGWVTPRKSGNNKINE